MGEDIIIRDLLKIELGIDKIKCLDIGTNNPIFLSNTYLLYGEGKNFGRNELKTLQGIAKVRRRNVGLNCGVAPKTSRNYRKSNTGKTWEGSFYIN